LRGNGEERGKKGERKEEELGEGRKIDRRIDGYVESGGGRGRERKKSSPAAASLGKLENSCV
jgi:hypothetical protein